MTASASAALSPKRWTVTGIRAPHPRRKGKTGDGSLTRISLTSCRPHSERHRSPSRWDTERECHMSRAIGDMAETIGTVTGGGRRHRSQRCPANHDHSRQRTRRQRTDPAAQEAARRRSKRLEFSQVGFGVNARRSLRSRARGEELATYVRDPLSTDLEVPHQGAAAPYSYATYANAEFDQSLTVRSVDGSLRPEARPTGAAPRDVGRSGGAHSARSGRPSAQAAPQPKLLRPGLRFAKPTIRR